MATIQCTICNQVKPEKDFVCYARKRHTECKECEKTVQRCTTCKDVKLVEKFNRDSAKRNGRSSICMECCATANRNKRRTNAVEINIRRRHRYATDPEYRAKKQAATIANYETPEGKARVKAYNRSERGRERFKRYKTKEGVKEFIRWYWREYKMERYYAERSTWQSIAD